VVEIKKVLQLILCPYMLEGTLSNTKCRIGPLNSQNSPGTQLSETVLF
jgi:hypothetical protein